MVLVPFRNIMKSIDINAAASYFCYRYVHIPFFVRTTPYPSNITEIMANNDQNTSNEAFTHQLHQLIEASGVGIELALQVMAATRVDQEGLSRATDIRLQASHLTPAVDGGVGIPVNTAAVAPVSARLPPLSASTVRLASAVRVSVDVAGSTIGVAASTVPSAASIGIACPTIGVAAPTVRLPSSVLVPVDGHPEAAPLIALPSIDLRPIGAPLVAAQPAAQPIAPRQAPASTSASRPAAEVGRPIRTYHSPRFYCVIVGRMTGVYRERR